jgi:transcriptional regulator with XRE-family HTH domain
MKPNAIIKKSLQNSGLTQVKFAKLIGKSQATLSKYISGQVCPSAYLIIHLMNKFEIDLDFRDTSADELASKIRLELTGTEYSSIRTAIREIIDLSVGHGSSR